MLNQSLNVVIHLHYTSEKTQEEGKCLDPGHNSEFENKGVWLQNSKTQSYTHIWLLSIAATVAGRGMREDLYVSCDREHNSLGFKVSSQAACIAGATRLLFICNEPDGELGCEWWSGFQPGFKQ